MFVLYFPSTDMVKNAMQYPCSNSAVQLLARLSSTVVDDSFVVSACYMFGVISGQ